MYIAISWHLCSQYCSTSFFVPDQALKLSSLRKAHLVSQDICGCSGMMLGFTWWWCHPIPDPRSWSKEVGLNGQNGSILVFVSVLQWKLLKSCSETSSQTNPLLVEKPQGRNGIRPPRTPQLVVDAYVPAVCVCTCVYKCVSVKEYMCSVCMCVSTPASL